MTDETPWSFAQSAQAPWLLEMTGTPADAYQLAQKAAADGIGARVVRGGKMMQSQGLYDEFAAALQFPDYFGENGAAFDECLTDLSWLPAPAYLIVIADAGKLLIDEDHDELTAFIESFNDAASEWATPVALGEWWDRPAKPFHIVFQFEADAPRTVRERFAAAGADLQPL